MEKIEVWREIKTQKLFPCILHKYAETLAHESEKSVYWRRIYNYAEIMNEYTKIDGRPESGETRQKGFRKGAMHPHDVLHAR